MTRTVRKVNIRVEVEPRPQPYLYTPEDREKYRMEEAERIKEEIRRHVDDYAHVSVQWDVETQCDTWGTDAEGNALDQWPACCTEDQQEFYTEHAHESDEWFAQHGLDDPEELAEWRTQK